MNNLVILGLQYGDEGKGKFTDIYANSFDWIVRYQGGDNAGHTIVFNNQKFSLRIIPSGIFNNKKVVIGNGCVLNPLTLFDEIKYLEENNFDVKKYLHISDKVNIIFDYHIALDKLNEENRKNKIGTTNKGIGPCYTDKVSRNGIRAIDLLDIDVLKSKLENTLRDKNIIFKHYNKQEFDVNEVAQKYYLIGQKLKPFLYQTETLLNKAYDDNEKILFEGAQGVMLDIDYGTYPFVTSSSVACGISAGSGLGITKITNLLGIVKAYTTRVGEGFFCTELDDEKLANEIREIGHEYGTVTKRPRRIGWIDLVQLKYSINISGATSIAITLLDVLSTMNKIKICVAYELENKQIDFIPSNINEYEKCKPIYIEVDGWNQDISNIKTYEELPTNCKKYIAKIQEILKINIDTVSVGPSRDQIIKVN